MKFLKYSKEARPGKKLQSKDTPAEHKKRPPVERKFVLSWKEGRPWLMYLEEEKVMTCSSCIEFYGESAPINPNRKGADYISRGLQQHETKCIGRQREM